MTNRSMSFPQNRSRAAFFALKKEGIDLKLSLIEVDGQHIHDLLAAEQDGRLVVLPCKIGDTIYIVEKNCFDCDDCKNKELACYKPDLFRICCDQFPGECPVQISERIVCGYEIQQDNSGNTVLSAPGEWGYEGFEEFSGLDGKWYLTHQEAEAALKGGES